MLSTKWPVVGVVAPTDRCLGQLARPCLSHARHRSPNKLTHSSPTQPQGFVGGTACSRYHRPQQQHVCRVAAEDGPGPPPSAEEVALFNKELRAKVFPFLLPVSVVVLSEPLLGLITSMFVGTYGTTVELAALGPASIVVSFMQYVFYSLQVATLALTAGALRDNDLPAAQRVVSCAIFVALVWGVVAAAVAWCIPENIIALTGVKDAAVIKASAEFLRFRAYGQPAVLVLMVTQAALLAQQKPLIPGIIITSTTLIAIAGHFVTVGAWGWGLMGAAYSTTLANILAAVMILIASEVFGKIKPRIRIPTNEDIQSFIKTVAPLSVTYLSKNTCYMLIQTTAASTLSVVALAAHQAVYSVWGFSSFLTSPVEQSALTFLPAATKRWQMLETAKFIMRLGPLIGATGGTLVFLAIRLVPQWFTLDASLWPLMLTVSGYALISMVFTGIDVSANGIAIALGDGAYVAKTQIFCLAVIFLFTSAVRYYNWGLPGVWLGIVVFFFVRAGRSSWRVWQEFKRTDKKDSSGGQMEAAPAT